MTTTALIVLIITIVILTARNHHLKVDNDFYHKKCLEQLKDLAKLFTEISQLRLEIDGKVVKK